MRFLPKYLPLLALLGAVAAHADDAAAPGPSTPAPAKPAKVLSVSEMTAQNLVIEAQLKSDLQYMEHLRVIVRRDKDVIKLNCVNDKYVQLKAQVNMFDTAREAFNATVTVEANARANFDTITKVSSDAAILKDEATGCVGVPELYKQESGVDVRHPDFPDDPTVTTPFDGDVVDIDPPGYASPFN